MPLSTPLAKFIRLIAGNPKPVAVSPASVEFTYGLPESDGANLIGTFTPNEADLLLSRLIGDGIEFQIETDISAGGPNRYAAKPLASTISIFVGDDDLAKARKLMAELKLDDFSADGASEPKSNKAQGPTT